MEQDPSSNKKPTLILQSTFQELNSIHTTGSNLNHKEKLLTNIIIYISNSYPQIQTLHQEVVQRCCQSQSGIQCLITTLQLLSECVIKEIVYGPSYSHSPLQQLPELIHKDMQFYTNFSKIPQEKLQHQEVERSAAINQLCLSSIISVSQSRQLSWYSIDKFLRVACREKTKRQVMKELSVEGQSWVESVPLSALLLILRKCYQHFYSRLNRTQTKQIRQVQIWRARLAFLHNKVLQNPVQQLSAIVLGCYSAYFNHMKDNLPSKQEYIRIMIEYSYALTFYYKYDAGKKAIQMARVASGLQIQYTGILGRRTKYQSFDTAQLVMNLKNTPKNPQQHSMGGENKTQQEQQEQQDQTPQDDKINIPNPKQLLLQQAKTQIGIESLLANSKTANYEQDSILLDVPQFLEDQQLQQLSTQRIMIVLASISHLWATSPKEETLYQHISTSIETLILHKNISYPIRFSLLFLRSLNEFPRVKHVQRALEQLTNLKDEYNEHYHTSNLKVEEVFPTPYQPHLSFIRTMADKLIQMGLVMSAVELFQRVGMYEDCIDGLIKRNYKQRALAMAQKLIKQKGQSPRLLCMIGDASKDDKSKEFYQKAWKLSNERYPRAQKSLGWIYFSQKDYKKSAQAFSLALSISSYQPGTWFTLGCAYMQMNESHKALKAFSQSICIDQTQGQAWGNMASCYLKDNRIKQAYSTLEQAVKHSAGNWKLWANLISVSFRVKQFYKYFQCIERLVDLDHLQVLNEQVFSKILSAFKYKIETTQRKMPLLFYLNRINSLYKRIAPKISQLPVYWHYLCEWNIYMIQYFQMLDKHYRNNQADPNDMISGYETVEKIQITTNRSLKETRQKIVQFKQLELNMLMSVGWEQNKIIGTKVRKILMQYINIYHQYSDKKDFNDFALFVKGLKNKLESCLEDPCPEIKIQQI